jgi:predicted MFS family arabinose efflux permease
VTATATPPRASPWSGRDFRLVWAGGLVNDTGDWLLRVALPVYVFTATSSGTLSAALFLIELTVSVVLGPFAGSLIDRWDLRRTLVVTNLLQAVTLLPLLAVTPDRIWPAFLVAAIQSVLTRINNPAKVALLPRLVGRDQLIAANAANAASESISRLVGSPLGGVIVELFGLGGVVVADGISFLAVAGATWLVRTDTSRASRTTTLDPVAETDVSHHSNGTVGDVFRLIHQTPKLRTLVAASTITSVAQGMFVVLYLAFVVRALGGGGSEIGLIRGVQAVGGVLASIAIARLAARVSGSSLFAGGLIGMGVVSFVTWNSPELSTATLLYLVLFIVVGFPAVAVSVGALTVAQQSTPASHVGRLVGTLDAAASAGMAAGSLAAGVLVDRVPLGALLNAQASIHVAAGMFALIATRRFSARQRSQCVAQLEPATGTHDRTAVHHG